MPETGLRSGRRPGAEGGVRRDSDPASAVSASASAGQLSGQGAPARVYPSPHPAPAPCSKPGSLDAARSPGPPTHQDHPMGPGAHLASLRPALTVLGPPVPAPAPAPSPGSCGQGPDSSESQRLSWHTGRQQLHPAAVWTLTGSGVLNSDLGPAGGDAAHVGLTQRGREVQGASEATPPCGWGLWLSDQGGASWRALYRR